MLHIKYTTTEPHSTAWRLAAAYRNATTSYKSAWDTFSASDTNRTTEQLMMMLMMIYDQENVFFMRCTHKHEKPRIVVRNHTTILENSSWSGVGGGLNWFETRARLESRLWIVMRRTCDKQYLSVLAGASVRRVFRARSVDYNICL